MPCWDHEPTARTPLWPIGDDIAPSIGQSKRLKIPGEANMQLWLIGAGALGFFVSVYLAHRGAHGAINDLDGHTDQIEASAGQTRQDVASLVGVLCLTNRLLAAILVAAVLQ